MVISSLNPSLLNLFENFRVQIFINPSTEPMISKEIYPQTRNK